MSVVMYSVFVILFAIQVMWLHQMKQNKRRIIEGCYARTTQDTVVTSVLLVGSILYVIVGSMGILRQF